MFYWILVGLITAGVAILLGLTIATVIRSIMEDIEVTGSQDDIGLKGKRKKKNGSGESDGSGEPSDISLIARFADEKTLGRRFVREFGDLLRKDLELMSEDRAGSALRLWELLCRGFGTRLEECRQILGIKDAPEDQARMDEIVGILKGSVLHVAQGIRSRLTIYGNLEFSWSDMYQLPIGLRGAFAKPGEWTRVEHFSGGETRGLPPGDMQDIQVLFRDSEYAGVFESAPCVYMTQEHHFASVLHETVSVQWDGSGFYMLDFEDGEPKLIHVFGDAPDEKQTALAWARLAPYIPDAFREEKTQ